MLWIISLVGVSLIGCDGWFCLDLVLAYQDALLRPREEPWVGLYTVFALKPVYGAPAIKAGVVGGFARCL